MLGFVYFIFKNTVLLWLNGCAIVLSESDEDHSNSIYSIILKIISESPAFTQTTTEKAGEKEMAPYSFLRILRNGGSVWTKKKVH